MANEKGLITRGEMDAHMQRIDERFDGVAKQLGTFDVRMKKVEDAVGANLRWVSARITKAVDQLLPIALTALVVFLVARA